MQPHSPIPPEQLKQILEYSGYTVVDQDEHNWLMDRKGSDHPPIPIPKAGPLVALDVLMYALDKAKINPGQYVKALNAATN